MNGVPFYIGSTECVEKRIKNHQIKYRGCTIFVLHEFEWKDSIFVNEREFWEYHFIWLFRSFGFSLDNIRIKKGYLSQKTKNDLLKRKPLVIGKKHRNYKDHELKMNKQIFKNHN